MFPLPVVPPVHYGTVTRSSAGSPLPPASGSTAPSLRRPPRSSVRGTRSPAGAHTLVVAPTGSGKTLSAFLWSLDQLAATPPTRQRPQGTTGPLHLARSRRSGVDVERNLRAPLVGITQTAKRLGLTPPEISRGGPLRRHTRRRPARPDQALRPTSSSPPPSRCSSCSPRRRARRSPASTRSSSTRCTRSPAPSAAPTWPCRSNGSTSCSPRPAQRIGLSATVRPHEEVGRFLVRSRAHPDRRTAVAEDLRPDRAGAGRGHDRTRRRRTRRGFRVGDPAGGVDLAARRGTDRRPRPRAPVVHRVRQLAAARRAADRPAQRDLRRTRRRPPSTTSPKPASQIGAPTEVNYGADPLLARAHHGSVSKDQRALIEDDLKSGRLRCVVATSSLELGIDMGAVDLVIQVEAPPSVASGLQRVGRAGHQVGEISRGVLFPKHRTDLIHCAVTVERMVAGQDRGARGPRQPARHPRPAHGGGHARSNRSTWTTGSTTVRRSGSFATLPRSAFESTLDLLAGRYPSDEFAELQAAPRLGPRRPTHSPDAPARSGWRSPPAAPSPTAVCSRSTWSVRRHPAVGELDEEMVYESRVGDVFALGATSWRIEEITFDRVLVSPAYGQPGRLPFWHGDGLGRPAELGRGAGRSSCARSHSGTRPRCRHAAAPAGSTTTPRTISFSLVAEQKHRHRAGPHRPHPGGRAVPRRARRLATGPALAVRPARSRTVGAGGERAAAASGTASTPHATASDDGIIVRLPDTEDTPPGADLFVFDTDEIEDIVTEQVGGSALFASRFRECAARALLLPRRNTGKAGTALAAAAAVRPAARRGAQVSDVPDPARDRPRVPAGRVRPTGPEGPAPPARRVARSGIVEVETQSPSPFAGALLFNYVGEFMYEGDSPLAERRAAALSLDSTLLAELLGRVELRELLDADVIAHAELELQRLLPDRKAKDLEGVADLLRLLGPLTSDGGRRTVDQRSHPWLDELVRAQAGARRLLRRSRMVDGHRGCGRACATRSGCRCPSVFPPRSSNPSTIRSADLIGRYARTHGPFTITDAAARFGLGSAVARDVLQRLAQGKRVVEGEFRPGATGSEWCDAEVLRRLRRRSLAAARQEVEPVSTATLGRFLPGWQHVGGTLRGIDGVATVVEQLAGCSGARLGTRVTDPAVPGGRLLPRHAGRTHLHRRGAVVGRGQHLREGRAGCASTPPTPHRSR